MLGTKFVVNLIGGDFQVWSIFTTIDEDQVRRFWLQRTGLSCLEQITESEHWEHEELCRKRGVTYMGYVK